MAKYFSKEEMACKCGCGRSEMDEDFMDFLDSVRELYGKPMYVTSGFRCPAHNAEVGGASTSAHLYGLAADIKCRYSEDRYQLIECAKVCGCKRFGIDDMFIHMDMDDTKPQGVIWVY